MVSVKLNDSSDEEDWFTYNVVRNDNFPIEGRSSPVKLFTDKSLYCRSKRNQTTTFQSRFQESKKYYDIRKMPTG